MEYAALLSRTTQTYERIMGSFARETGLDRPTSISSIPALYSKGFVFITPPQSAQIRTEFYCLENKESP